MATLQQQTPNTGNTDERRRENKAPLFDRQRLYVSAMTMCVHMQISTSVDSILSCVSLASARTRTARSTANVNKDTPWSRAPPYAQVAQWRQLEERVDPQNRVKRTFVTVVKCLDLPSLEWCETYILNKCRPAVYYRQLFTSISWGGGWFQGGYERSPVGSTPKVLLKWRHRGRAVQVAEDYIRCSCNDCLVQPPVHRSTVGNWAFSVAGPQVWNCLPPTGGYIDTVSGDLPHSTQDVSVHESYPDIRLIWPSCVYTLYSGPRSISILK